MTSLHEKLSVLLAAGKPAEIIVSEMMSEVERVFPLQHEPVRDLIVEFVLEKAITNQQLRSMPLTGDNVLDFLQERSRRGRH